MQKDWIDPATCYSKHPAEALLPNLLHGCRYLNSLRLHALIQDKPESRGQFH